MKTDNNSIITLSNSMAECKISLFGGNILSYRPKNQEHDVFWLGDLNKFDNIQAIRGGIPVCWPRFSEETLNNYLPRHGFARLSHWKIKNVYVDETNISLQLYLIPDDKYNLQVKANLYLEITDKLTCRLETINYGKADFEFSEALHAYFYVGSRDETQIKGLKNCQYKNNVADSKIYSLENDLYINKEFDAAFINHTSGIEIIDNKLNRIIKIDKKGSNSTVVWNPDKDLPEMSFEQYKHFVCVEPANQGENFVKLASGEKHEISMQVCVKSIK